MSKTLEEIRQEIDLIDNQVHDLLMQRAGLVSSVASAKKEQGLQIVQPAREARMMRRLLGRHSGPLPHATIIRIWRELVGSVALLQTGLSVVVSDESQWDTARDYFGSVVPMKTAASVQNALGDVLNDDASFAVLPWPELDEVSPWWSVLFSGQVRVICALPYGIDNPMERALVVSKIDFMPSDDDISLIGLEVTGDISRARIKDMAEKNGLEVINQYRGGTQHLLETCGYREPDDFILTDLKEALGDACTYIAVMGGYPVVAG